jgi:formamidopyrimidine-DNA glycosylase
MPELPEVEVIRRGLLPHLPGRTIERVVITEDRLRVPVPRRKIRRWVQGCRVESLGRRAKHLVVTMGNGAVMVLHLGMSGRLALLVRDAPRAAHDHVHFSLDSGLELRFNDVRRFGSIRVLCPDEVHCSDIFAPLGPEPLEPSFSGAYLLERCRGRRRPVKNVLMDSTVVVGIGNIYANEILFAAGIRPTTAAGTLGKEQWDRIVRSSRRVLQQAIRCGGTTISDFVNSSGQTGYFQSRLNVYGRGGRPCRNCGRPIVRLVLAGRASFYCPRCQS